MLCCVVLLHSTRSRATGELHIDCTVRSDSLFTVPVHNITIISRNMLIQFELLNLSLCCFTCRVSSALCHSVFFSNGFYRIMDEGGGLGLIITTRPINCTILLFSFLSTSEFCGFVVNVLFVICVVLICFLTNYTHFLPLLRFIGDLYTCKCYYCMFCFVCFATMYKYI